MVVLITIIEQTETSRSIEKMREILKFTQLCKLNITLKIINRAVNKRVDNLRFWKMYLNRFVIRRRNFGTLLFRKRQKPQKPQNTKKEIFVKSKSNQRQVAKVHVQNGIIFKRQVFNCSCKCTFFAPLLDLSYFHENNPLVYKNCKRE